MAMQTVRKGCTLKILILSQLFVLLCIGSYLVVVKYGKGVQAQGPPPVSASNFTADAATPAVKETEYLAACALVKEAPDDVLGWLRYHRRLGIAKFYLALAGNSTVQLKQALANPALASLMHLVELVEGRSARPQLYRYCLNQFGARHIWMAFIDANEYFVFQKASASDPGRLPVFLQEYEEFGGLVVNWRVYGSSWHTSRPPSGTVLDNYAACAPANADINRHVKSIVRTDFTVEPSPLAPQHIFRHVQGKQSVDVFFDPVLVARSETVLHKELVLHHYVKSQADFLARHASVDDAQYVVEGADFFGHVDSIATEVCQRTKGLEQFLVSADL